jgi:ribonuclease I
MLVAVSRSRDPDSASRSKTDQCHRRFLPLILESLAPSLPASLDAATSRLVNPADLMQHPAKTIVLIAPFPVSALDTVPNATLIRFKWRKNNNCDLQILVVWWKERYVGF